MFLSSSFAAIRRCSCLVAVAVLLLGASPLAAQTNGVCLTESQPFTAAVGLTMQDDLDFAGLQPAIAQSLHLLERLPPARQYSLCGEQYSVDWLKRSLREFSTVVSRARTAGEVQRAVAAGFLLCRASGEKKAGRILLTGYFEPLLTGSLTPDERYRYPLYRRPPDLESRVTEKGREWGRLVNGQLLPYWSRQEIEQNQLLKGLELLYLDDPLAVFVLQVQGSGQVALPDGSFRRVQYAAKSGRPYRSIGKLLVDEGALKPANVDLPAIIRYLRQLPAPERARILHHNESYVFFRWGNDGDAGPHGSFGVPLTAGRSVALDQQCFPPGALAYLRSRKPRVNGQGEIIGWEPFSRFVLNQDSGSAIVGSGRADLFWGGGEYAETAAGAAKHPAELLFLIKKK